MFVVLRCWILGLGLGFLTWSVQAGAFAAEVPQKLAFEVRRDGALVGSHCLVFSRKPEGLRVDVMMELRVPIPLWFDYSYRYRATEWWRSGRLDALRARIEDGAQRSVIDARTRDGTLEVDGPQGLLRLTRDLLPSNHWNAAVLHETQLLNTLTGGISALDVRHEGTDRIAQGQSLIIAERYRLGGDLEDTRVWYDREGQWRGLAFTAPDGSAIRLYPVDTKAQQAVSPESAPWNRNPVCHNKTGALSG